MCTVVIRLDEQLKRVVGHTGSKAFFMPQESGPPQSFKGGYADFIEYAELHEAARMPTQPRTSLFDDMNYYHLNHHKHLELTHDPRSASLFLQKIMAAEVQLVNQYTNTLLIHLGWLLSQRRDFGRVDTQWVEECWNDLLFTFRRVHIHRKGNEDRMRALNLTETRQNSNTHDWKDTRSDYVSIATDLDEQIRLSETLISSFTGLASIVGTRRSLDEARSVRILSVLAMTFLPLSLTASIFSMSNEYGPGQPKFPQFFAVSIPLLVVVVICVALLNYGPLYLDSIDHFLQPWKQNHPSLGSELAALRRFITGGRPAVSEPHGPHADK